MSRVPEERCPTDATIRAWLSAEGLQAVRIERLPGDVSIRAYLRVYDERERSSLLSYSPPELRDTSARFLLTTALLEAAGVRTPHVLASSAAAGWILVEDLGNDTIYDLQLPWRALEPYYRDAADSLRKILGLDPSRVATLSPPLDDTLLVRELEQTWNLFLEPQHLIGGVEHAAGLRRALAAVCQSIGSHNLVPCHRDFMARNLMPIDESHSAVIDHQDLRLGPRYYDLASLLNDSLFAPPSLAWEIAGAFVASDDDHLDYRRATLQRTLKAVGTFVAFHRRGNDRHLGLIAPTLARAGDQLEHLPETRALASDLAPLWRNWSLDHLLD